MNLTKISNVIKQATDFVIPTIIGILVCLSSYLAINNKKLANEVELKTNNIEAYLNIVALKNDEGNVLRLDLSTLLASNDNLLHKLDSVAKRLKISEKAIQTAISQRSTIEVTVKDVVLLKDSCNFVKLFKPNNLTLLDVVLNNDTLQCKLRIDNDLYLYIYGSKEYKNKGKNFFKRLISFDWKKMTYYKYKIVNTNDLIKVGSTRIIEKALQ